MTTSLQNMALARSTAAGRNQSEESLRRARKRRLRMKGRVTERNKMIPRGGDARARID